MSNTMIPLSLCKTGDVVVIENIQVQGIMRRRLLDLGFVKGSQINVLQKSPLGDPVAYRLKNTTIALRSEESSKIFVKKVEGDR